MPVNCLGQSPFWIETFGNAFGCDQGTLANGWVGANGTWTVSVPPGGINDTAANEWYISATEPGLALGNCAVQGCDLSASITDRSLHVGNVFNSPNATSPSINCPTGDCGAVYDMGGFQIAVETNKRAESPVINCTGFSNISLVFNYLENGDSFNDDNTLVEYSPDGGTTWLNIDDPVRTPTCGVGLNQWSTWVVPLLPSSADNNANIKIGFRWVNDNGGQGVNPSFAVDSIRLFSTSPPVADFTANDTDICTADCINFFADSSSLITSYSWTFFGATPATSSAANPANVCYANAGTFTVQLIVSNAAGTDTMIKTNYITVNSCSPPVTDFIADSTQICERGCITFTDLSTGAPTTWLWSFPGGIPSSSNLANPPAVCYYTPGTYSVTLTTGNLYGTNTMVKTNYITIDVCPLPVADFIGGPTSICNQNCVSFSDLSTFGPIITWQWSFPGATPDTSSAQNPGNICYPVDGLYDVQLIAGNQYGTDTVVFYSYIHVESVPGAFISPDTAMAFGSSYQMHAFGGLTYVWSPATGLDSTTTPDPVASPLETTTYTCTITDFNGCTTTRQVTVTILHENDYFIPNTFSPNKDGSNDYFFVRGNNIYGVRMTIYDRWGERIFETANKNEPWDGLYKGKELDAGVYTYIVTLIYNDGDSVTKAGSITLVK
jgi:gliding motility-associated-like protein